MEAGAVETLVRTGGGQHAAGCAGGAGAEAGHSRAAGVACAPPSRQRLRAACSALRAGLAAAGRDQPARRQLWRTMGSRAAGSAAATSTWRASRPRWTMPRGACPGGRRRSSAAASTATSLRTTSLSPASTTTSWTQRCARGATRACGSTCPNRAPQPGFRSSRRKRVRVPASPPPFACPCTAPAPAPPTRPASPP